MSEQSSIPDQPLAGPGDIIRVAARQHASKTALITAAAQFTYGELDDMCARAASGLRSRGVRPGQTVTLYGPNSWQWVVAYHAILRAGAVVNPINVMLTPPEVAYVLADSHAVAVLTSAGHLPKLTELAASLPEVGLVLGLDSDGDDGFAALFGAEPLADADPADPAALSTIGYTSGTTGHPKGAMQSQQSVLLNCALTATMERFAADEALALIARHRATMFEGVPAMYAMLLASPALASADLTSLRVCTVGGQTISNATISAWQERSGAPLIELWGMTEIAGLGTTHAVYAPPVPGSIGVALPGIEVRVADLEDVTRDAPPGVPGELMVRGPIVMMGYFGNPEETARTIEPDGWLHTGDIAYADQTGHFFVVDRRKDLIITAGYNVYPAEIERVLSGHPAVAMVAVGPVKDEIKGELACAYVVRREGAEVTAAELIDYTHDRLAAYKRPREVVFLSALPATSTGKIMRRKLADARPPEA